MHVPGDPPRRSECAAAWEWLPSVAAGDSIPAGDGRADGATRHRIEGHVATCLRCQAEVARYRRLRRTMRGLGQLSIEPGPEVLPAILASLQRADGRRTTPYPGTGRRTVYVGGVAVATAGAAAGMLVWVTRRRPNLAG